MIANHLTGLAVPFTNLGVGHGFGLGVAVRVDDGLSGTLAHWAHLAGVAWPQPISGSTRRRSWWHSVSLNIFPAMSTAYFNALPIFPTKRWPNGMFRFVRAKVRLIRG